MQCPTVLVVDDSLVIRAIVRRTLASTGYTILDAPNGHTAVRLARESRPDLILLDLCLPDMDGWDVVRQLQELPGLVATPIIVMSGYGALIAEQAPLGANVQRVISKPFDINYLAYTVMSCISLPPPAALAQYDPLDESQRPGDPPQSGALQRALGGTD